MQFFITSLGDEPYNQKSTIGAFAREQNYLRSDWICILGIWIGFCILSQNYYILN
jgi:hypothetical protein